MNERERDSEAEGPPPSDTDSDAEDRLEEMIEDLDRPMGSDLPETTPEEQRRGPSLEMRTRTTRDDRPRSGGITLSEEEEEDEEPEMIGEETEPTDTAPEARAMRTRTDAPGGVWNEKDDYIPEEEPAEPNET